MSFHFTGAIAYDVLGSSLRIAANVPAESVIDPQTGVTPVGLMQNGIPVDTLYSDDKGRYTFETADTPGVRVDWGAGPNTIWADEVPELLLQTGGLIDGGTPSGAGFGTDIDGGLI